MYAVIKTGGKQYRVSPGQKLKVEHIPADIGQELTLDQVLSVGEGDTIKVGTPYVSGAVVKATILAQGRHKRSRYSRCVVVKAIVVPKDIAKTIQSCVSTRSR